MPLAFYNHESHIAVRGLDLSQKIDHIPPFVYRLHFGKEGLDLIKERPKFDLPKKTYGDHKTHRDMIISDFSRTEGTLGVMLTGIRGAGKSLLGEELCNYGISADRPVLLVNEPIPSSLLKAVIEIIGSCIVYFDEYGKVYKEDDRERMLSFFSDSSLKKVMFIVTGNEFSEMSKYMYARPGRFRYHVHFTKLGTDVIEEMGVEYELSQSLLDYMKAYVSVRSVSFDILNTVMPLAAKAKATSELDKLLTVLNVPSPVRRSFNIENVSVNGTAFYGEAIATRMPDGEGFSFKLVDEESLQITEGEVVIDLADKTLLKATDKTQLYLIHHGDITLKVEASWADTAESVKNNVFKSEAKKQKG